MSMSSPPFTDLTVLTDRQRQCLNRAARGLTSRAIGEALGISSRTVDEHLAAACAALGVRTRVQAAAIISLALPDTKAGVADPSR